MKLLLLLMLSVSSVFASSDEDQRRMNAAYEKAYSRASINCEYKYWIKVLPVETVSQQFQPHQGVYATYKIGDDLIRIGVSAGGERGLVDFKINGIKIETKLSGYNYFHFQTKDLNVQAQALAEKINLTNLTCSLEIGHEDNFLIEAPVIHVNMHPHPNYDWNGENLAGMARELVASADHLMLFDDHVGNIKKARSFNFNKLMVDGRTNMKQDKENFLVPELGIPQIPLRLSQAGHNRYTIKNPDQTIIFSGGNHNYCILNNTRRALHAFMENPAKKSITFEYPTDAIVVQKGSWLNGGGIPRGIFKRTNLLSRVFDRMSDSQKSKYIGSYHNYFKTSYLSEKQYYFGRAIIKTEGIAGFEYTDLVQGKGEGDIQITLRYR